MIPLSQTLLGRSLQGGGFLLLSDRKTVHDAVVSRVAAATQLSNYTPDKPGWDSRLVLQTADDV